MPKSILVLTAATALALAGVASAQTANPDGSTDTTAPASGVPATGALGGAVNPPATSTSTPPAAMPGTTAVDPATLPAAEPPTQAAPPARTARAPAAVANASATSGGYVMRGQQVRDSSGHMIGRISGLTNVGGHAQAVLRVGSHNVTVPLDTLHSEGAGAVSSRSRAELQATTLQATTPAPTQ